MTTFTYVLQFTPRAELGPEDRRILKDDFGDAVRLILKENVLVAIDQHDDLGANLSCRRPPVALGAGQRVRG